MDQLQAMLNSVRERRAALESAEKAFQTTEAEFTDPEGRVQIVSNTIGEVSEILLNPDWYRDSTAEDISRTVMRGISQAQQSAAAQGMRTLREAGG